MWFVVAPRRRPLWVSVVVLVLSAGLVYADDEPSDPCDAVTTPALAAVGAPPRVRFWRASDLGDVWVPPACSGWQARPITSLLEVTGRFILPGGVENLLERFAEISAFTGIRYWSISDQRWAQLITHATALTGPDEARPRPDFSLQDLRSGARLYFLLQDNRSARDVVFRAEFREVSLDRVVMTLENLSDIRFFLLSLAGPGALRSLYVLRKVSDDVWEYTSLGETGADVNALVARQSPSSLINRAIAYFRYFAGIPTDLDPPAASR